MGFLELPVALFPDVEAGGEPPGFATLPQLLPVMFFGLLDVASGLAVDGDLVGAGAVAAGGRGATVEGACANSAGNPKKKRATEYFKLVSTALRLAENMGLYYGFLGAADGVAGFGAAAGGGDATALS